MICGHAANAVTAENKPACAICNCVELSPDQPSLEGRYAKCYCGCITKSDASESNFKHLPFFEYCPDKAYDRYYCGHDGWD